MTQGIIYIAYVIISYIVFAFLSWKKADNMNEGDILFGIVISLAWPVLLVVFFIGTLWKKKTK